jgi:hypothetical protein
MDGITLHDFGEVDIHSAEDYRQRCVDMTRTTVVYDGDTCHISAVEDRSYCITVAYVSTPIKGDTDIF